MASVVEFKEATESEMELAVRTMIEEWPAIDHFTKKDAAYFSAQWKPLMKMGMARVYVSTIEGRVIGLIMGTVNEDSFSGLPQAIHCVWQVAPEYRGRLGIGTKLFKMFEEAAEKAGCKRILFSAPNDKVSRFYQHAGYTPLCVMMEKRL
jgi:ribosomal protein S18 acetylase RimI-like enzyme